MTRQFDGTPIRALKTLIEENIKPGIVVAEIGVWDGSTTVCYSEIVKNAGGKIILVDWFCGNIDAVGAHGYVEENAPLILERLKQNIKLTLDVTDIKIGNSSVVLQSLPDSSIDILFIDADHKYKNVYDDIKHGIPKVRPGGIICGHDCERLDLANTFTKDDFELDCVGDCHPGVVQAVYDHFGNDVEIREDGGPGSKIWIKRL